MSKRMLPTVWIGYNEIIELENNIMHKLPVRNFIISTASRNGISLVAYS